MVDFVTVRSCFAHWAYNTFLRKKWQKWQGQTPATLSPIGRLRAALPAWKTYFPEAAFQHNLIKTGKAGSRLYTADSAAGSSTNELLHQHGRDGIISALNMDIIRQVGAQMYTDLETLKREVSGRLGPPRERLYRAGENLPRPTSLQYDGGRGGDPRI